MAHRSDRGRDQPDIIALRRRYLFRRDLARFDIIVHRQSLRVFTPDVLYRLHERHRRLVYDTADIRFVRPRADDATSTRDPEALDMTTTFLRAMDALILASPLQRRDFEDLEMPQAEIARPLLNRRHRTTYAHGGPIRVVWQGYPENLAPMQRLHPIIRRLRAETGLDIRLVYDTGGPARDDGPIQYTEWKIHRWERVLIGSDVGVVIKPLDDPFQQRKAPTKVVSYMGAGLPVVCTPSEADRRVITHGETGFFAYDDREWHAAWRPGDGPVPRERVGTERGSHVLEGYGVGSDRRRLLTAVRRLLGHRPPRRALARAPVTPSAGDFWHALHRELAIFVPIAERPPSRMVVHAIVDARLRDLLREVGDARPRAYGDPGGRAGELSVGVGPDPRLGLEQAPRAPATMQWAHGYSGCTWASR